MDTTVTRGLRLIVLLGLVWVCLSPEGCLIRREQVQGPKIQAGRILFEAHCAACHQPDGLGAAGGGPPLVGSSWVRGPESLLIRIVLHGVRGSIEVGGKTFDREMLGFGQVLNDSEIASLLTYVRSRWGNVGMPVRSESVGRIRRDTLDRTSYWTVEELLQTP